MQTNTAVDVNESERITPYQWKVLSVVVFGYLFDGLDSIIFSLCLSLIMLTFGIDTVTTGKIASIFLCGQILGGLTIGFMGDALGRKKSLITALLIFSLGTILCALAPIWGLFALFRAVTGFGTVGAQGPMSSMLAETWPAKYRSRVASAMMSMWGVAGCFGAIVVALFADTLGWQGLFIAAGICGLIVAIAIHFVMEESTRFAEIAKIRKENKSTVLADVKELFANRRWRKHVIIGMMPPFCQLTILWGFLTLLPPYVIENMGYALTGGMKWFFVTNLVGTFGFLLYGFIADAIGRKSTFALFGIIAALSLPLSLLWAPNETWFYILSSSTLFAVYGTYSGIMTYLPELFPTRIRSTGVSVTNQLGRLLSMIMPYLVGLLAMYIGTALALSWLSLVWVTLLITLIFGPETKGRTLEEITGEV